MSEVKNKMNVRKVTYRRPLNDQQLKALHVLYWYRFCTSRQLAHSLEKSSHKAIQNKLQILEDQGLIAKRYDSSYKLAGRPAEYFLLPKGARQLEKRKPGTVNQWATKSLYKNKTVSDDFLAHCITITELSQRLGGIYGDNTKLLKLPKSYMVQGDYYPRWTPDLHLEMPKIGQTPARHYFLDIWDGSKPFFVSVKKTRNYVNFKEAGDWLEDEQYPAILAVCQDAGMQKKLNRQIKRILDESWDEELVFATTTMAILQQASKPSDKIWTRVSVDEDTVPTTLRGLTYNQE